MLYNALAVSGDPCSGKTKLIERLVACTGWEAGSIGGMFRATFESWKKTVSPIGKSENDFDHWWAHKVSDETIRKVNIEATERLSKGSYILDSRYALHNAQGLPNVAVIYLTAPLKVRGQRALNAGRYPHVLLSGAGGVMDILYRRSQEEFRRGLELYNFDYRDLKEYDLVLNTNRLTLEQEVAQACTLLNQKVK